jgi:hypothetical protein
MARASASAFRDLAWSIPCPRISTFAFPHADNAARSSATNEHPFIITLIM